MNGADQSAKILGDDAIVSQDIPITVKQLKEWIDSIPETMDNLECVLDGTGGYPNGYNSVTICSYQNIKVSKNFPENKEDDKEIEVVLLRIM